MASNEKHPAKDFLSDAERSDVVESQPARAAVIHESIRLLGDGELQRGTAALAWSSVAAGLSMGFSPMFKGILHSHIPAGTLQFFVENMGYSIGFLVVILARQQLFTENTLTAVLPVMSEPSIHKLLRLIRLWSVVLCGNLIGVTLFAFGLLHLQLFTASIENSFLVMGQELMTYPPMEMFTKAILAGWLIATMVWLLPSAPDMKFWIILLFTYLIGIGGFTHVIVSAEEGVYLMMSGKLSVVDYAFKLLAPVLLGNIVGGTIIFALINHAQVRSES